MTTVLDLTYNFASLSLRDLLEARDTYHYHLLSKANVVGTAVGLYLIRKDEDWPQRKGESRAPRHKKTYARTLTNSEVRDYSWPCVLAFVRSWAAEADFGPGGQYDPAQIVPKTLYMPDGRAVPVCVVEAPEVPADETLPATAELGRPADRFGGGLPIIVEVQGAEYHATAGCLVTDGHLTYALTARHACGEAGTPILSTLRGGRVPVGTSSPKQLTRVPFSEVYPDFPGRRSYCSLDVGLVRLDKVDDWTSNTYGLPPLGPLADVNELNLSLRLIDQPVMGYGAASGLLRGAIKALFYRHRSVGGYDYVGDFLIAPDGLATRPGDSGMVWHLDVTPRRPGDAPVPLATHDLRPLAVEWGGQTFDEGGRRSTFAVATGLSNVCKLLDVELVTDLSRGVSGYWGRTGHYSIAALAIGLVGDARLKAFLEKNAEIISFDLTAIAEKDFDKTVGQMSGANHFVPLADVPDEIWKKLGHGKNGRQGGRDTAAGPHGSDGPEHPTHYADIDAPIGPHGETWRKLCLADDKNITVTAWKAFYAKMAKKSEEAGDEPAATQYRKVFKQGLLPFRLWRHPMVALSGLGSFTIGALMMGVVGFLPTYVQTAMGRSALDGGLVLAAMTVTWTVASFAAGHLMIRTSYRATAIAGGLALLAGSLMLLAMTPHSGVLWAGAGALLVGIGMGSSNTTYLVSVQAAVDWHDRGGATSSNMFMRIVGQSVGAALFGAMVNIGLRLGAPMPTALGNIYILSCVLGVAALVLALRWPAGVGPTHSK